MADDGAEEETVREKGSRGKWGGRVKKDGGRARGGKEQRSAKPLTEDQRLQVREAVTAAIEHTAQGGEVTGKVIAEVMQRGHPYGINRFRSATLYAWFQAEYNEHQSDLVWAVVAEQQRGDNGVTPTEAWARVERTEGSKKGAKRRPMWREKAMHNSGYSRVDGYEPIQEVAGRALRMLQTLQREEAGGAQAKRASASDGRWRRRYIV